MSKFEATTWMHQISPWLLFYVEDVYDEFIRYERHLAAFEKAREPKKLIKLDSAHLQSYAGEKFEAAAKEQIGFLKEYL